MTSLTDVLKEIEAEDDTEFKITLQHLLDKHVDKGGELEETVVYRNEALRIEIVEHREPIIFQEAEYQGRKVKLGKPMQGDVKKFKVYVKDPKTGNVKKVNFGQKGMVIKKNNPGARKSFRARHKCDQKKDRTTAGYWSCRKW